METKENEEIEERRCSTDSTRALWPMPLQSEEQRIREVLRELKSRKEGGEVKEDIERIERILRDPLFKQLSAQKSIDQNLHENGGSRSQVQQILKLKSEKLIKKLENSDIKRGLLENQKLHVVSFDAKHLNLQVLGTREKVSRLLIVGPKDVKQRSSGKLRIGDCVVAIDATATSTTTTADSNGHKTPNKESRILSESVWKFHPIDKSEFESINQKAIEGNPGHHFLVIGVVREATPMVLSGDWTQVEVIRLNTETGGLGFGIVGGTSTGVVVKTILPGSPADKDGHLQPGDHILQIGSINTHGMSSQQVATILRHQHPTVEMIVGRPIAYADKPADTPECFTLATKAALCATTLEEALQRQMATSAPSTAAVMTPATMSPSVSCAPIEEEKEDNIEPILAKGQNHNHHQQVVPEAFRKASIDLRKPCDCAPGYNRRESSDKQSPKNVDEDRRSQAETLEMTRSPTADTTRSEFSQTSSQPQNNNNGKGGGTSSSSSKMSLKSLQEMALTVFLRENWANTKYEMIDVLLHRDPALGLGITVAGYVHKKEEIGGIFVKSLVPRSSAALSGVIRVHDLILEVNATPLEHMSHADSVRTLVKSGDEVQLKLVRFSESSSQAQCLKMLQQQETETQVIDVKLSNPDLVREWKSRVGDDIEIVTAVVKPDRQAMDGGLGISLEGTVDVLNGAQLCPHHYIESIRENGPVAKTALLQAGDELLQVNHSPLYGESHVTVRQALTRAVHSGAPVTLIVARRSQKMNVFEPTSYEKQLPLSFPFLAENQETVVKAKSNIDLTSTQAETTYLLQRVARKLRSKSLENFHGLAVWNCVPLVIFLNKDARGLGFSIVDYKDPTHRDESVIVVQSLVPGGIAQADGRIVPGDRLLFVNNHDLSNSSLERAVAVLKAARMGPVRLGIAKPIPVDESQFTSHTPLYSRSERLLARGRSPRGRRRYHSGTTSSQETVWIGTAEQYRKLHPQGYYPSRSPSTARSERSLTGSEFSMTSWSPCSTRSVSPCGSPISLRGSWAYDVILLPSHLERTVKLQKGPLPLGVVLDGDKDKSVNGCVVKSICGKKAVALDGRIQVGDYIVKINTESLRNVTNSQARAILKRTNLVGTYCNVTYITSADAKTWKERFQRPAENSAPIINRLSPKVFPKFYRSPYMNRKDSQAKSETDDETEAASIMTDSMTEASKVIHAEKAEELATTSGRSEEAEAEARRRLGRLIDGTEIDEFVGQMIREAIADAAIELNVLHKTKDWSETRKIVRKSSEKEESPPLPPPPPEVFEKNEPEPVASTPTATVQPIVRQTSPTLIRRDSEPPEFSPTPSSEKRASSQLHILSTAEELEQEEKAKQKRGSILEHKASIEAPPIITSPRFETSAEEAEEVRENGGEELKIVKQETLDNKMPSSRVTSRTPSTGSESLQNQARQLAKSKYWGEARTVTLNREPNKSFGISIVGGRVEVSQKGGLPGTGNTVCGIFIKSVLPNSPAGRSGQMNMGDRVISVNDVDLRDATHEQAVNAIKNASNPVRFVLQSLHTNSQNMINSASNSTVNSVRFENSKPEEVQTFEQPSPVQITPLKPMMVQNSNTTNQIRKMQEETPTSESSIDESTTNEEKSKNDNETSSPDIQRENTVKRRSVGEKQKSAESIKILKSSNSNEAVPLIVSDVSSSEANDEMDQVLSPSTSWSADDMKMIKELGIEQESAAFLANDGEKMSNFGYTKGKIDRKYGEDEGELIFVNCERPEAGLGISLAGNRDREKQSVFVVNVKTSCPLPIRAGDELLEINGRVLRRISHVTASTVVRECCERFETIEIVLRRKDGALEHCAVVSRSSIEEEETRYREEDNINNVDERENQVPQQPLVKEGEVKEEEEAAKKAEKKEEEAEAEEEQVLKKEMPPTTTETMDNSIPSAEVQRKKSFSIERTAPIDNGRETMIEIDKDGKGLGLSIVGGADTVLGTVVIHEVYPDGAAAHDGRLKPGDQVLEVNGISLRGVTHDQSIAYLRRTPPKVRLLIYRDVNLQLSLLDPTQIYNMFEIDITKKAGRGLGISIVGRKNEPGVYVSEIVKGGAAETDGRLMPGDQILEVNSKDVTGCMQEDVAAMLKTCSGKVHLKLGRWKITETANRVHAATEALAKSATTPRVCRKANENNNDTPLMPTAATTTVVTTNSITTSVNASTSREDRKDVPPPAPPMMSRPIITHTSPEGEVIQQEPVGLSPVTEEPSSGTDFRSIHEEEKIQVTPTTPTNAQHSNSTSNNNNSLAIDIIHDLKEDGSDTLLVELKKSADQQLGMGIGKRTRGILVTSLQPGSTAAEKLKVGDRIMAVNALPVTDQLSAVTFVKASGERLFLQIARPKNSPTA